MSAPVLPLPTTIGPEHGLPVPEPLSRDPAKRILFGADTYFREGWDDLQRITGVEAPHLAHDHGLLLLKPDAVAARVLTAAIDWLAANDGTIVAVARPTLDPHVVRAMWQYQFNAATRDRRDLADLATGSDRCLLLVVRLPMSALPTSVRLSAMKGPADPAQRSPASLRTALGGSNFLLNYVHASDEPADLVRELAILLRPAEREVLMAKLAGPADSATGIAEARLLAAGLERQAEPHDLQLATALDAIGARAVAARDFSDPAQAAAVQMQLAAIRGGRSRDWRALADALDTAGVDPGRWDLAVIGTHVMDHSEPGVEPILRSAARELWEQGTA